MYLRVYAVNFTVNGFLDDRHKNLLFSTLTSFSFTLNFIHCCWGLLRVKLNENDWYEKEMLCVAAVLYVILNCIHPEC
jgi:hypothetical protein